MTYVCYTHGPPAVFTNPFDAFAFYKACPGCMVIKRYDEDGHTCFVRWL
jgi:hypothetical protein